VGGGTPPTRRANAPVLVLAVGNLLMGDEGVGLHVLRAIEEMPRLRGVRLLDGGTGGVNLLAELERVAAVVMIDATRDGRRAGTVSLLRPKQVTELPRGLSAHDFGVKDLFAAAALLGHLPEIHLFTISVEHLRPMCLDLTSDVADAVPLVADAAYALAERLAHETCDGVNHSTAPDCRTGSPHPAITGLAAGSGDPALQ